MTDLATQLLMDREGFSSSAYWDVNHWRVGYGSDTWTDANGNVHNVTKNTTVTANQAAADLSRRVDETQQHVINQIGQPAWNALGDGAKAGLTSFAYNYGSLTPSVVRAAQSGDNAAIAQSIAARAPDNSGVNAARRAAEASVVLSNAGSSPTNVTTNTAGPDDRPSMAQLYGNAPAPLAPPMPRADSAASSLPSNADFLAQMGIGNPATPYDPANPAPAQHITDMNYPVASLPPPNLPLNGLAPPAPSFMPSGDSWSTPLSQAASSAPPVPMPSRPAGLDAAPTAPAAATGQHPVMLNGKLVMTGTYPSKSNPGSIFTVTDDGTGKGVVKLTDPGLAGGIGPGTIAGSIVGKTIGDAVSSSLPAAQQAIGQAGSDIGSAASNLGANAAAFGGGLLSGIGGLFGSKPSASPTPSFLPTGSSWKPTAPPMPSASSGSSSSASQPSFLPSGNSWSTPLSPPPAPPAPPPPQSVQVTNPAYSAWQAQYGNQGGLSTGTSQNTVSSKFDGTDSTLMGTPAPMPVIPPAPPQYITKTVPASPLALQSAMPPPVPMPTPSWMLPVMPSSATFGTDPLSQLIAKSKLGGPIAFLGGSQNNYGYLAPAAAKSSQSVDSIHAQLMAKQHNPPQIDQNGNPVTAMNGQTSRASPYVNAFGMVN